jgi:hypothetical protein
MNAENPQATFGEYGEVTGKISKASERFDVDYQKVYTRMRSAGVHEPNTGSNDDKRETSPTSRRVRTTARTFRQSSRRRWIRTKRELSVDRPVQTRSDPVSSMFERSAASRGTQRE